MFNMLKRQKIACRELWDVIDNADHTTSWQSVLAQATPPQRAHAAQCEECRTRLEELAATRDLLAPFQSQVRTSRPGFTSRVMSAIAVQEVELTRAVNAWTLVPKLASRVAWAAGLAILMAVSLLYQKPATPQLGTEPSSESLFDNAPSPASHDDVLTSMVEQK